MISAVTIPQGAYVIEGKQASFDFFKLNPKHCLAWLVKEKAVGEIASPSLPIWQLPEKPQVLLDGKLATFSSPINLVVRVESKNDEFLKAQLATTYRLIALDHVTDPRNLGAIVRSASFFGYRMIIVPQDRQALLSQTVISTSQGGFSTTSVVVVKNLSQALLKLKEAGFWVLGADMGGESISGVGRFYTERDKICLVLGNEGNGLAQLTRRNCDRIISIEGMNEGVNSLNVSVAAAILMHELKASHLKD